MLNDKENYRRATDHKFQKRFLLIPIVILVVTVVGFLGLKTFERQAAALRSTETKTTATVEFDKDVPTMAGDRSLSLPPPRSSSGRTETTSSTSSTSSTGRGTHFQLSVDVLRERENIRAQRQRWYAQLIFSMLVGLSSIYVILSRKYPDDCNKWAYSTLAFVMGFWLKGL